jgi:hypothetical protein
MEDEGEPIIYSDDSSRFSDLPTRLDDILKCKIKEINQNKISMECSYKGLFGYPSKCGLGIETAQDKVRVTLTELLDNEGTSITNIIEHLATMVYHQFLYGIEVTRIQWIEHYPACEEFDSEETFDEVEMLWDDERFSSPKWKRIKMES